MTKEEQIELGKQLIAEMRAAFARNDWDATTSAYEQMEGIKTDRAINLEATCLAVRALAASGSPTRRSAPVSGSRGQVEVIARARAGATVTVASSMK